MNDEAVILENLLLRLSALNPNPVLPNSNRTFCFPLTDKDRKALGDCIYKYLGEHYPESPFAIMRNAVKEAKGKPKLTNFNYITASPERLAEWWYDEKEDICQGSAQNAPCSGKCEQCLLEWLKQEAKENTNDKP